MLKWEVKIDKAVLCLNIAYVTNYLVQTILVIPGNANFCWVRGLLQQTITWYKKSAMLEGKLIIIPALGHF